MNTVTSATLGLVFLGLSFAVTFLMFYLWGFPFDKATRTSAAPKSLMRTHRVLGYAYATVYVVMMTQMVPRMWQYQVELPPRTVAHLTLGFLIGIILLVKIAILRFFRHLEEWMPFLGTALFVCTVLLLGLSLPFAFRERALARSAVGGDVFSPENRKRVSELLPQAGLPPEAPQRELATTAGLNAGRSVLLDKCVRCHDLKTVLAQPRTPSDWVETVSRMANKPAVFAPITPQEQWEVSTYLIAITPDLQRSAKQQLAQVERTAQTRGALASTQQNSVPESAIDAAVARTAFRTVCSQCHGLDEVDKAPPRTVAAIQPLLQRMIDNGMRTDAEHLRLIRFYLTKTYVNASRPTPPLPER